MTTPSEYVQNLIKDFKKLNLSCHEIRTYLLEDVLLRFREIEIDEKRRNQIIDELINSEYQNELIKAIGILLQNEQPISRETRDIFCALPSNIRELFNSDLLKILNNGDKKESSLDNKKQRFERNVDELCVGDYDIPIED